MPRELKNRIKSKLAKGEIATVAGGLNTPDIIEFLGQFGFDGAFIDTEHGVPSWNDIANMSRACDVWGMTSVVRVTDNVSWLISRTLDVGAQAIVVPHVNTANEARAIVRSAKYFPVGARGSGGGRLSYGISDYVAKANEETLLVALLEEKSAIDNLDEILRVEGIDVFFPGPGDLAQSMGYPGRSDHPEVQAVIDKAIAQIAAAGKVAGAVVTAETAESYARKGARFFLSFWLPWLAKGARELQGEVAAFGRKG
jgi:2-keto-3-deoxy-L-rhamnonate aldolase RhmA